MATREGFRIRMRHSRCLTFMERSPKNFRDFWNVNITHFKILNSIKPTISLSLSLTLGSCPTNVARSLCFQFKFGAGAGGPQSEPKLVASCHLLRVHVSKASLRPCCLSCYRSRKKGSHTFQSLISTRTPCPIKYTHGCVLKSRESPPPRPPLPFPCVGVLHWSR